MRERGDVRSRCLWVACWGKKLDGARSCDRYSNLRVAKSLSKPVADSKQSNTFQQLPTRPSKV